MPSDRSIASRRAERGQRLWASLLRALRAYANGLAGISWKRFALLSMLLIVASAILESLPPFSWRVGETLPAREVTVDKHAEKRASDAERPKVTIERTRRARWGDFLTDLALLWVVASIIIKAAYKGRMQAEAQAARATETAEAESLKRQVIEARMAAMQAQAEPHFLFNTLASIDHLIETDAPRASRMQKHLIALLRASMPTMREANVGGARDPGRELAVVRPYLEILKMRMEERLHPVIDVPDGLLSAEFPPMMLQARSRTPSSTGWSPRPKAAR